MGGRIADRVEAAPAHADEADALFKSERVDEEFLELAALGDHFVVLVAGGGLVAVLGVGGIERDPAVAGFQESFHAGAVLECRWPFHAPRPGATLCRLGGFDDPRFAAFVFEYDSVETLHFGLLEDFDAGCGDFVGVGTGHDGAGDQRRQNCSCDFHVFHFSPYCVIVLTLGLKITSRSITVFRGRCKPRSLIFFSAFLVLRHFNSHFLCDL